MNTMKWLMKREFWEHKGGFVWTPIVVGALMTVFLAISLIFAIAVGKQHGMQINGVRVSNLSAVMDAAEQVEFTTALTNSYMGTGAPLFIVLGFVVFFFCLASLFDERKDRSVLFWKSLPVSDHETVLSKVAMALVAAPLVTLVVATITSLLSLIIICIAATSTGLNVFGPVLGSSALYLAPFQIAAALPVYMVWALPTVGWLMMVSAWARTKPFLWAVGLPLLAGGLYSWFNAMFAFTQNTGWFWKQIIARGLLSVVPGSWFAIVDPAGGLQSGVQPTMMFMVEQSWRALATPTAWIGAALGVVMIYAAIRLRRYRDEG